MSDVLEDRETFEITIIMTGRTIAKTYDQRQAAMRNAETVVERLVGSLRLVGTNIVFSDLMRKDSLDLDDGDRSLIVEAARAAARKSDAVIVIHGTDTLSQTGEALFAAIPKPAIPIILTGAMVPSVVGGSDGLQNVTEALFACKLLAPAIYSVFHGRALTFPGIKKDRDAMTLVRVSQSSEFGETS